MSNEFTSFVTIAKLVECTMSQACARANLSPDDAYAANVITWKGLSSLNVSAEDLVSAHVQVHLLNSIGGCIRQIGPAIAQEGTRRSRNFHRHFAYKILAWKDQCSRWRSSQQKKEELPLQIYYGLDSPYWLDRRERASMAVMEALRRVPNSTRRCVCIATALTSNVTSELVLQAQVDNLTKDEDVQIKRIVREYPLQGQDEVRDMSFGADDFSILSLRYKHYIIAVLGSNDILLQRLLNRILIEVIKHDKDARDPKLPPRDVLH